MSNKDRDLFAFARVRLGADGTPGPIEVIAERSDAELNGALLDKQGSRAALLWNVGGRTELAFVDLRTGRMAPGPALPAELSDLVARQNRAVRRFNRLQRTWERRAG